MTSTDAATCIFRYAHIPHDQCPGTAPEYPGERIVVPEGTDVATAAAAEHDANSRAELATAAREVACAAYQGAQDAYDLASEAELAAIENAIAARRAHIAAMRAAGLAQTADGYVTR